MPKPRKFCNNQIEAKEDVGEATYTCMAHLAEALAFPCPYKESDIKVMNRYGGEYSFEIPTGYPGGGLPRF